MTEDIITPDWVDDAPVVAEITVNDLESVIEDIDVVIECPLLCADPITVEMTSNNAEIEFVNFPIINVTDVLCEGESVLEGKVARVTRAALGLEKGVAGGVATLGEDGKVPSGQLPSYVDDVIEVSNYASLPTVGETGKIYVTLDNNHTYRWSGSVYVEIGGDVPTALSQLTDDPTHRLVTDTEKGIWNCKAGIDDDSTSSLTESWSASKLNSVLGDISSALDTIRGV